MFTGLIREFAEVQSFQSETLKVKSDYSPNIGDSIAVNGACLTVVSIQKPYFEVELSKESRDLLALENYASRVHMEPAMQLGDRIEGHMLQGHVDCLGRIEKIEQSENAWDFYLSVDSQYMRYMMPKGSIAVDGVSLTINEIFPSQIRLTIINHTMQQTLFQSYQVGQRVNVETDMFARYLYHMLHPNEKMQTSWDDIEHIQALF